VKTLSIIFLAACLGFVADAIRAATPASGVQDATVTIPANLMDDARHAKDAFDQGRYMDCQKIYERMLTQAPDNVYILSNLGVVYFRNMNWKLAEDSLKKATAVNPKDAFSHLTLGIVYYEEKRYDDALLSVNLALAINPKYQEAVNYKWLIEQTMQSIAIPTTLPFPNASPVPTIPPGDYPTEHELELQQGSRAARASLR